MVLSDDFFDLLLQFKDFVFEELLIFFIDFRVSFNLPIFIIDFLFKLFNLFKVLAEDEIESADFCAEDLHGVFILFCGGFLVVGQLGFKLLNFGVFLVDESVYSLELLGKHKEFVLVIANGL
jgi:hypothetical protein